MELEAAGWPGGLRGGRGGMGWRGCSWHHVAPATLSGSRASATPFAGRESIPKPPSSFFFSSGPEGKGSSYSRLPGTAGRALETGRTDLNPHPRGDSRLGQALPKLPLSPVSTVGWSLRTLCGLFCSQNATDPEQGCSKDHVCPLQ
ncbi:hypothetical protein J1605_009230 [Eschrichtius robustus]|uniref:Uncharacterized protein n=1 Tax=Eschrichtius robustus TaxID=9764 RepID=A0AB34GYH7_ESCRO|nr:hypothetical protein J1605_009230 [Eschrichtius robustus]